MWCWKRGFARRRRRSATCCAPGSSCWPTRGARRDRSPRWLKRCRARSACGAHATPTRAWLPRRQTAVGADAEVRRREPPAHPCGSGSSAAVRLRPLDRPADRRRAGRRARAAGLAGAPGAQARPRRTQVLVRERRPRVRRQGRRGGGALHGAPRQRSGRSASTRSRRSSKASRSPAPPSPPWRNSGSTSTPSSKPITRPRNPSSGPRQKFISDGLKTKVTIYVLDPSERMG